MLEDGACGALAAISADIGLDRRQKARLLTAALAQGACGAHAKFANVALAAVAHASMMRRLCVLPSG
jgi:hypothetical protein